MNQGFSVNAPTFIDVGSDGTLNLQNLKVIGGVGSEGEQIQILGSNGIVSGDPYVYLLESDGMEEGWYMGGSWDPITEVSVPKGTGFIFFCDSGAQLQSAGEVVTGETRIPLNAGFTVAGNSTNIDRDLQDFKIEGGVGSEGEQIQLLGSNGIVSGDPYVYLLESDGMEEGWYMGGSWEPIENVTIKAGQSHIFYTAEGATLVIPSQLD